MSLFGYLKFGVGNLFPGGPFGDVGDEGRSSSEGYEKDLDMGESAGEEDVEQSDIIEE